MFGVSPMHDLLLLVAPWANTDTGRSYQEYLPLKGSYNYCLWMVAIDQA